MKCKFEHDGHCCNCGATQYMIECKQPCETIVPMTNADRIRAMTDEELTQQLTQVFCEGFKASTTVTVPDELCHEIWVQFYEQLQQPAEGDA